MARTQSWRLSLTSALFILIGGAALLSCGCDAKPSDADGEAAVKKHVGDSVAGFMELATFNKTDGQSSESNGIKSYRIDFDGTLKALQACTYGGFSGQPSATAGIPQDESERNQQYHGGKRFAQAGDVLKINGRVFFEKSEAGWTVKSVEIKPIESASMSNMVIPTYPAGKKQNSNNIFGIPTGGSDGPAIPSTPSPSPAVIAPAHRDSSPSAAPAIPSIPVKPMLSVSDARAKLDAATANVERTLTNDPAYRQAKADVAAADAKKKAALNASGAGSPEVLETAQQLLDAKAKLQKLIAAAAAKDPVAQAAQRELSDAEKAARKK